MYDSGIKDPPDFAAYLAHNVGNYFRLRAHINPYLWKTCHVLCIVFGAGIAVVKKTISPLMELMF